MAPRLTVVGSINLDLVVEARTAAASRRDRERRALLARARRQGREPGGRGGAARGRGRDGRLRRAATSSPDEALAGLREAGVEERWIVEGRPDRDRADHRRCATGRRRSSSRPARTRELRPEDLVARRGGRGALPAGDPGRDGRAGRRARAALLPQRRAGARRRSRGRADRREPARARGARRARPVSSASRSAPRARSCSRTGRRWPARSRRAVEAVDGTAAGDAFTACLVVSLLEGRAREESLRRACVAGALAASRSGAQSSLPTAEEVDALL